MQTIIAIVCLALALWVDPAGAQSAEYSLKVSIHEGMQTGLTQQRVEQILAEASSLLKDRNGCDVKFRLDGSVGTFTGAPRDITNAAELEAVHRVNADVKVVESITFCKTYRRSGYIGCAWRREGNGSKTVIVTPLVAKAHILWAHEFGHTKGLQHRAGDQVLMTPCQISPITVEINQHECDCFLGRPGAHCGSRLRPTVACAARQ